MTTMPICIDLPEINNFIKILGTKQHSEITQTCCYIQMLQNRTHDVNVDDKHNPTFVLLVPLKNITELCFDLTYHLYVDDNGGKNEINDVELGQFLDALHLDDKSKSCEFSNVNLPVFSALLRYFKSRGIKAMEREGYSHVFKFDRTANVTLPELDKSFELSSIRPDEVDEIKRCWVYSSDATKGLFKWSIDNYPSTCIRDKTKNGKLASFVVATFYGTQNHLFTYPEYRRKGFSKIVLLNHAKILEPIFGQVINLVIHENKKSFALMTSLNFKMLEYRAIFLGTQKLATDGTNTDAVKEFDLNY